MYALNSYDCCGDKCNDKVEIDCRKNTLEKVGFEQP
jgi:hypothetical protein